MTCTPPSVRRLVFLTVNSSYSHSSLALPLLHSACRDLKQWEWLRYDMTLKEDVMNAVRDIYSRRCDLLVANLYLFNRNFVMEILRRYHAVDPRCRIAVGGPECLGDGGKELLDECPWLDCVFRGEGEQLFREYLEHFDENSSGGKILPVEGNGVFEEWASSPYPVNDPFFVTDKPFVQMETSRGCPMGCFYCTSGSTRTRYRSLEQVREELTLLSAKGVRELRLLDRTFNLPQERGAALLRMFREEFPGMRFHLELHPQFLNDALRQELLKALPGQLHVEAGIQCLDSEVQRLAGRRSDVETLLKGLAFLCEQSAFETHADLLAGLPGQKWSHILADAAELVKINVAEIQLEVLKALPGTPLRRIAPDHGVRFSVATPYDVMMTDTMSLDEIQQARDLSRLLDMTYNHKALHPAVAVMNAGCPGFLEELLEFFHKSGGSAASVWDLKKRFLFLAEFCRQRQLKEGAQKLAFQWLLAGFPPGQGADEFSQKVETLPENLVLLTGSADCVGARETRNFRVQVGEEFFYFAFNRAFALNLPAAVWGSKEAHKLS